jgi:hypothetical protein
VRCRCSDCRRHLPEEGQAVAGVLEAKRRGIETTDLEARITVLEKERE